MNPSIRICSDTNGLTNGNRSTASPASSIRGTLSHDACIQLQFLAFAARYDMCAKLQRARSQASDMGSIPIARSSNLDDSIALMGLSHSNPLKDGRFWTLDGRRPFQLGTTFDSASSIRGTDDPFFASSALYFRTRCGVVVGRNKR